jgi:hypothetical protein
MSNEINELPEVESRCGSSRCVAGQSDRQLVQSKTVIRPWMFNQMIKCPAFCGRGRSAPARERIARARGVTTRGRERERERRTTTALKQGTSRVVTNRCRIESEYYPIVNATLCVGLGTRNRCRKGDIPRRTRALVADILNATFDVGLAIGDFWAGRKPPRARA